MVRKLAPSLIMGIASLLVLGATAIVPAGTALAGGKDFTCTDQGTGPDHQVTCLGIINGNVGNIDISNVQVLSGNQVNILEDSLNNNIFKILNLDVQTQLNTLAADVVNIFIGKLNIPVTICQVTAGAIGQTNNANCG
jgi:hypothetical protein